MSLHSPLRARLASFEHAYAVAVQRRRETGRNQLVVRTNNPMQPFRVTTTAPQRDENLLLQVA
jgi:hypothetical protein